MIPKNNKLYKYNIIYFINSLRFNKFLYKIEYFRNL